MKLVIGLDTGGTYTDAALLDVDDGRVLATGKSLTTRDDLSIGLGEAIAKILQAFDGPPSDISMVSLSTTLATNAVVEGVGGRVGLFGSGCAPRGSACCTGGAFARADCEGGAGLMFRYFHAGGRCSFTSPGFSSRAFRFDRGVICSL